MTVDRLATSPTARGYPHGTNGERQMPNSAELVITLDIDWAPDAMIDAAAAVLLDAGVRATWFVTHASAAVERLRERADLFELGIHPNFLPGSTHGVTAADVLSHCMALAPEARVVRTHGLVQSSQLLAEIVARTPIRIDSSLLLRGHPGLQVVEQPYTSGVLQRVPIWWEDDVEQVAPSPNWDVVAAPTAGLRVLNFHPVHIALNGRTPATYAAFKRAWPQLSQAPASAVAAHHTTGDGPAAAFARAISALRAGGGGRTLSDIVRAAPRASAQAA